MSTVDEKQSSGNSQERLTHPPENEQSHDNIDEKPAEPAGETASPTQREQGAPKPAKELDVSRSFPGSEIQARELYTNWQFLVVFVVGVEISKLVKS